MWVDDLKQAIDSVVTKSHEVRDHIDYRNSDSVLVRGLQSPLESALADLAQYSWYLDNVEYVD